MTGYEVLEQALCLLHYTDNDGHPDSRLWADTDRQGLAAVNQVYAELWYAHRRDAFTPLARLSDPLALTDQSAREAMPLGVAMWMAQGEGDAAQQAVMAQAYTQKRNRVTPPAARRQDVLPRGEWV
ncbi:MAG: hypothetical protein ACOYJY_00215 [Acutalibacteraceae bacterium]